MLKIKIESFVSLLLVSTLLFFPIKVMGEEGFQKNANTQRKTISQSLTGKTSAFKLINEQTGLEFNLLGTGHAVPFSKLPSTVQNLVNNTHILFGEIPKLDGYKEYVKKVGFGTSNVYQQLDPDIRNRIEQALKAAGREDSLETLSMMKPWMIYIQVMQIVEGRKYVAGMDLEIMNIIGKKNKGIVVPLETLPERIDAMGIQKMTIAECQDSLAGLFQPNRKQFEKAVNKAYLTDLETLHRIMGPSLSSPDMTGMLKNRNDLWLKKLPLILKSVKTKSNDFENKTPLIAVGAAHLLGRDGLLVRLSKMGYKIQRYCKNGELIPYKPHF